jgi:RNA polymerase sigma-70 factor (family 1)
MNKSKSYSIDHRHFVKPVKSYSVFNMDLRNSEILEGINKGNKKIFDQVFKNYYPGLCNFAKDYLKSPEAAQEIIQEIFLYLWEHHDKIQIKISLKAYLYRSVYNRCMNYIRDNFSILHNEIQIDQLKKQFDLSFIELTDKVFEISFSENIEQELEEAIESLPEQCEMIFRLNRFENLMYPEIAVHLNISLSTVKTQMGRAMTALQLKMKKFLE